MIDRENVITSLEQVKDEINPVSGSRKARLRDAVDDAIALLKEQEKKRIALHKNHVITWRRNDEFSMGKLYEAICETLLDEGELFVARTDNHEKVDFVFYVAEDAEGGARMYRVTAKLPDGELIEMSGTLAECIEWADRFALDNPGAVINIKAVGV